MSENEQYGERTCYNMQAAEMPEEGDDLSLAREFFGMIHEACPNGVYEGKRTRASESSIGSGYGLDIALQELMGIGDDDNDGGAGAA
jgi:hypothetical protein